MTTSEPTGAPASSFHAVGRAISSFAEIFDNLSIPDNALDHAEGRRLFWRYFTIGLEQFVEYTDPAHPAFHQNTRDGVRKFAGDSPTQLYDSAKISAEHSYVITGSMAETELIEFGVYSGDLSGQNPTPRRLIDALTEEELEIAADGTFTLHLHSAADNSERAPNTLLMEPDASSLSVRRYLRDPRTDRPRPLQIERTSPAPPPAPLSGEDLDAGVGRAVAFAAHNVELWSKWADNIKATKRNVLASLHDAGDIYTPKGHSYLDGYWELADGEVLTVEFRPPAGCYWSFVPMNYWMESFEWRFDARVYASSFDTTADADGYVRLALAEHDPGLPGHTWLQTLGHREGLMVLRVARLDGPMPAAATEVIQQ
ncbi:hypothetical protein [Enemella sp. A6]|uniref:hypothetical protein n=1 Tax=Enemella sp. A6 TaxID=3440152 RepID=UPI003EBBA1F7